MNNTPRLQEFFQLIYGRFPQQAVRKFLENRRADAYYYTHAVSPSDGHETATGYCCQLNDQETLRVLLEFGADYDIYCACILNDLNSVREMLKKMPMWVFVRSPHVGCLSLLELKISVEMLLLLETQGAQITILDAVRHNLIERVKQIVRSDASVLSNQGIWGDTALHLAMRMFNYNLVEVLLELGADPTVKAYHGYPPAALGIDLVPLELFKKLYEPLVTPTSYGYSIGVSALICSRYDILDYLQSVNADFRLDEEIAGEKAIDALKRINHQDAIRWLREHSLLE